MSTKYTKELLEEAVANSISYAGVLRYLGLRQAGGTQSHVKNRIKFYDLDVSHFKLQGHNKGRPSPKKKSPEEVFQILPDGSCKAKTKQLKRALLESGVDYRCVSCYNGGDWNGLPLGLEIDHIDGNWLNNQKENLRFLCPNCHSQQPTNRSWKHKRA